jgi:hypothetical protein
MFTVCHDKTAQNRGKRQGNIAIKESKTCANKRERRRKNGCERDEHKKTCA